MLGLNGLRIVPNYRSGNPYDAWVDYVKAWTSIPSGDPGPDNAKSICRLAFLDLAGIGFFSYPLGCPSWVPNFSELAKMGQTPIKSDPLTKHMMLAGADDALEIDDGILKVKGRVVQRICRTALLDRVQEDTDLTTGFAVARSILRYLGGFVARNPRYITGDSPLHAFTRVLLNQSDVQPVSEELFRQGFELLLSCCAILSGSLNTENFENTARNELGLDPGTKPVRWLVDNFWTASEIRQSGISKRTILRSARRSIGTIGKKMTENFVAIHKLFNTDIIFETEDGYVGACPRHSQIGDVVCAIYGYKHLVVLRPCEGGYQFVGKASAWGFMSGEAFLVRREAASWLPDWLLRAVNRMRHISEEEVVLVSDLQTLEIV